MRGKKAKTRILQPDPIYSSRLVTRLINRVMKDGKRSIAASHVYKALEQVEKETKKPALEVLRQALERIKPAMEVRSRRVGGAAYQVPMPVRGDRRESLSIRWMILSSRTRPNSQYHHYHQKLAAEIIDSYKGEGGAVKKRENIQKMADANKAFSHFRW